MGVEGGVIQLFVSRRDYVEVARKDTLTVQDACWIIANRLSVNNWQQFGVFHVKDTGEERQLSPSDRLVDIERSWQSLDENAFLFKLATAKPEETPVLVLLEDGSSSIVYLPPNATSKGVCKNLAEAFLAGAECTLHETHLAGKKFLHRKLGSNESVVDVYNSFTDQDTSFPCMSFLVARRPQKNVLVHFEEKKLQVPVAPFESATSVINRIVADRSLGAEKEYHLALKKGAEFIRTLSHFEIIWEVIAGWTSNDFSLEFVLPKPPAVVRVIMWDGSFKSVGITEGQTAAQISMSLAEKLHSPKWWQYPLYLVTGLDNKDRIEWTAEPLALLSQGATHKLLCDFEETAAEPEGNFDSPTVVKTIPVDPLLQYPDVFLRLKASCHHREKIELYFPDGGVTSVEVDASSTLADILQYLSTVLPSFSSDAFSLVLQTAGDIQVPLDPSVSVFGIHHMRKTMEGAGKILIVENPITFDDEDLDENEDEDEVDLTDQSIIVFFDKESFIQIPLTSDVTSKFVCNHISNLMGISNPSNYALYETGAGEERKLDDGERVLTVLGTSALSRLQSTKTLFFKLASSDSAMTRSRSVMSLLNTPASSNTTLSRSNLMSPRSDDESAPFGEIVARRKKLKGAVPSPQSSPRESGPRKGSAMVPILKDRKKKRSKANSASEGKSPRDMTESPRSDDSCSPAVSPRCMPDSLKPVGTPPVVAKAAGSAPAGMTPLKLPSVSLDGAMTHHSPRPVMSPRLKTKELKKGIFDELDNAIIDAEDYKKTHGDELEPSPRTPKSPKQSAIEVQSSPKSPKDTTSPRSPKSPRRTSNVVPPLSPGKSSLVPSTSAGALSPRAKSLTTDDLKPAKSTLDVPDSSSQNSGSADLPESSPRSDIPVRRMNPAARLKAAEKKARHRSLQSPIRSPSGSLILDLENIIDNIEEKSEEDDCWLLTESDLPAFAESLLRTCLALHNGESSSKEMFVKTAEVMKRQLVQLKYFEEHGPPLSQAIQTQLKAAARAVKAFAQSPEDESVRAALIEATRSFQKAVSAFFELHLFANDSKIEEVSADRVQNVASVMTDVLSSLSASDWKSLKTQCATLLRVITKLCASLRLRAHLSTSDDKQRVIRRTSLQLKTVSFKLVALTRTVEAATPPNGEAIKQEVRAIAAILQQIPSLAKPEPRDQIVDRNVATARLYKVLKELFSLLGSSSEYVSMVQSSLQVLLDCVKKINETGSVSPSRLLSGCIDFITTLSKLAHSIDGDLSTADLNAGENQEKFLAFKYATVVFRVSIPLLSLLMTSDPDAAVTKVDLLLHDLANVTQLMVEGTKEQKNVK